MWNPDTLRHPPPGCNSGVSPSSPRRAVSAPLRGMHAHRATPPLPREAAARDARRREDLLEGAGTAQVPSVPASEARIRTADPVLPVLLPDDDVLSRTACSVAVLAILALAVELAHGTLLGPGEVGEVGGSRYGPRTAAL